MKIQQMAWLAVVLAVGSGAGSAQQFSSNEKAESIRNLDAVKKELREYQACTCTCGCYAKDIDTQAEKAIGFLKQRVAARKGQEKLAVVLDIDETSLSNYEQMQKADFAYDSAGFNAWVESAQAPVIPGTLRLVQEAKRQGVVVIFLTGRAEKQRVATERNLKAAGYEGWEKLILRAPEEKGMTATAYKSAERQKLVAAGYVLILSVGDQWSDLKGAPEAEFSVKYPNPYYFLP